MNIEIRGLDELTRELDAMPKQVQGAVNRGLTSAAKKIKDEAVRFAPRSPTSTQIRLNRKTRRPTKKKANAFSRAKPGGLERSIAYKVWDSNEASIFVTSNSEAGKYAEFIHDGTYNLGIGSVAKAARGLAVGSKFIERAVDTHRGLVERKVQEELKKLKL